MKISENTFYFIGIANGIMQAANAPACAIHKAGSCCALPLERRDGYPLPILRQVIPTLFLRWRSA